MERVYCKYCGKYKPKDQYNFKKKRCKSCVRNSKNRFDPDWEVEMLYKHLQEKMDYPVASKPSPPVSTNLKVKRRKRQEQLDLREIDDYFEL